MRPFEEVDGRFVARLTRDERLAIAQVAEQGLLDPSAQADWLLQEAETLVHFGRWANPMLHGDLDWLRASEAEEQAMRLVLWQAMAWESAAALDAARTVKSLANVWSVPGWLKDGGAR